MSKHKSNKRIGKSVSKTSPAVRWVEWVLMTFAVIGAISVSVEMNRPEQRMVVETQPKPATQHQVELGPNVDVGTGELRVVYETTDFQERVVEEPEMAANFVKLVDRIQDEQLWAEWATLCRQFNLSRDDSARFFYVMPADMHKQLGDGGWFGTTFGDPRPGCVTVWCQKYLLLFPERTKSPKDAALLGEVSLVHELQHIRDFQAGRLATYTATRDIALDERVKPGTELYGQLMASRVELFATEIRAVNTEFQYIRDYRPQWWATDDLVKQRWYRAWETERVSDLRSCIYDAYVSRIFPTGWKMQDPRAVKSWMLQQVQDQL